MTGIVEVGAGEYEYEQFEVPADASIAIIRGSFFVSSGSVRDIHAMILDDNDFDDWKAGETPDDPLYFSGNVIATDIEAKVPSGSMLYLVFDNTYSSASEKSLEAEIELAYLL